MNTYYSEHSCLLGRNGDSPRKGIDTLMYPFHLIDLVIRRNGDSPRKGIDTPHRLYSPSIHLRVEMGIARERALTHQCGLITILNDLVEMGIARERALTHHPDSVLMITSCP